MTVAAITGQQPMEEVDVLQDRHVVLLLVLRRREAVGRVAYHASGVVRQASGDVVLHDRSMSRRSRSLS